jgi:hypothetical protein
MQEVILKRFDAPDEVRQMTKGQPYAILCHAAVNAAHLVLQEGIF